MYGKIKPENIKTYLRKIDALFPEFGSRSVDSLGEIKNYYEQSFWGYKVFHSWGGAIHMALSKGNQFSRNDYFTQAEEIQLTVDEIKSDDVNNSVLEIGCGAAFNIRYLAEHNPEVHFIGVDISDRNLKQARQVTNGMINVCLRIDDFHSLRSIDDDSCCVVFAVETICHAIQLEAVMRNLFRVTKNGGKVIIFDGFRSGTSISDDLDKAVRFAEKSMSVPRFFTEEEFTFAANKAGFTVDFVEDRSKEIVPNLVRLSDLAKAFFKVPALSRLIIRLLPDGLAANAVAGLLMAVTVTEGAHRYMKIVLKKV
jgi:SAM-dependent methyltransferase